MLYNDQRIADLYDGGRAPRLRIGQRALDSDAVGEEYLQPVLLHQLRSSLGYHVAIYGDAGAIWAHGQLQELSMQSPFAARTLGGLK